MDCISGLYGGNSFCNCPEWAVRSQSCVIVCPREVVYIDVLPVYRRVAQARKAYYKPLSHKLLLLLCDSNIYFFHHLFRLKCIGVDRYEIGLINTCLGILISILGQGRICSALYPYGEVRSGIDLAGIEPLADSPAFGGRVIC